MFGTSPSKPVFWVLQTEQSSRAVERYQLTLKGKLVTTYVLFTAQQSCTWFAPGQAPPGSANSATVPSCSGVTFGGLRQGTWFHKASMTNPASAMASHIAVSGLR